jgi:hypothetical protein
MSAAVMSVTLLATSSSGVGTRVALTTMRGSSSSAGAVPLLRESRPGTRKVKRSTCDQQYCKRARDGAP